MVSQFKISLQINRNMEEYKYLNGVKVGDEHYFKNLEDVIESIWGKKEQGKKPVLRIFDHYDFIERYSYSDKTDKIDFYLCFPKSHTVPGTL